MSDLHSSATSTLCFQLGNCDDKFIVDAQDRELAAAYRWCGVKNSSGNRYVRAGVGKGRYLLLHRVITNAPKGKVVDHINGDTLDNRRCNLRVCTSPENLRNSKLRAHSRTGVRNVTFQSKGVGKVKCWRAVVRIDGVIYKKWFGNSSGAKADAERWATEKRRELHGEFAFDNRNSIAP